MGLAEIMLFKNKAHLLTKRASVHEDEWVAFCIYSLLLTEKVWKVGILK